MSILDRCLLVLLALFGLCSAAVCILFSTGTVSAYHITLWSQNARDELIFVVIAIVFAFISARFLVYRLGRPESEFIVLPGDFGHIRISFDTFRQLSDKTGQAVRGVESFETRVRQGERGIVLAARVRVHPDVDITATSQEIQRAVKEYIERITSVTVERITVNITEISTGATKSSRVRVE